MVQTHTVAYNNAHANVWQYIFIPYTLLYI